MIDNNTDVNAINDTIIDHNNDDNNNGNIPNVVHLGKYIPSLHTNPYAYVMEPTDSVG